MVDMGAVEAKASVPRPWELSRVCLLVFFSTGALLAFGTMMVPGYLHPGAGRVAMGTLVVVDLASAAYVLWRRDLSKLEERSIAYVSLLNVFVACLSIQEPAGARLSAIVFMLPGMFAALFLTPRQVGLVLVLMSAEIVYLMRHAGDSWLLVAVHAATVVISLAGPSFLIAVLRGRLAAALHQSQQQALTDPLTGLANRRGMLEQVEGLVTTAASSGQAVGVMCADIDHFKTVNDTYGHAVGDEVLREVADAIRRCVRPSDVVVRMGGEEIAVLAVMDPHELVSTAERIRTSVATACARWAAASSRQPVTVSVGVAWSVPDEGALRAPDDFVSRLADAADGHLYDAKRTGRDRVRHASPAPGQGPLATSRH